MRLTHDLELVDLGIYVKNVLIISDIHIGYEEALNKQGIFVPRFQFKEILRRFDSIFVGLKNKKIETVVVAGDLKHEFGSISEQEWRHTLQLLDYLGKKASSIVLLRGNHDTILGPIAQKRKVIVADFFLISDAGNFAINRTNPLKRIPILKEPILTKTTKREPQKKSVSFSNSIKKITKNSKKDVILIGHGDILPPKELLAQTKTIIIGHEHPALSIAEGPRTETFKCFLVGKWKEAELIVMPSLNLVTEGTDVLKENLLSPFLHQDIGGFRVIVVSDKLYDFGKLRNL